MKKFTWAFSSLIALNVALLFSSFTEVHVKTGTNKDSVQKPTLLTPYNFDVNKPVTARALRDNVQQWNNAWKNKEVTVIAWAGGGVSGNGTVRFTDQNNPGNIVFEAGLVEGQSDSLAKYAAASPFVSIRGKIKESGRKLTLENCRVTGVADTTSKSARLNPFLIKETTAVFPKDIIKSVDAWKGIEVIVKDKCSVPMSGNTISFIDDKAKPNRYGLQPDLIRAVLRAPLKSAKTANGATRPIASVKKLKGKINRFDESTGELSLYDCEILP